MIFSKSRLEERRRGPRILGYAPSRPSMPRVSRRANCLPEKFAEYASEAVRGLYMQLAANMSSPQALLKLPFCVAGLGNGNSDRETLRMKCDASTCCGPVIVGSVIKNKRHKKIWFRCSKRPFHEAQGPTESCALFQSGGGIENGIVIRPCSFKSSFFPFFINLVLTVRTQLTETGR